MKRWALLVCFLSFSLPASALEVKEVVWGFDGQVVPYRFNLLSVFVFNPTESIYEGELVLYKTGGVGGWLGARLVSPCFVAPHSGRWVQFYPFVNDERDEWVLVWGRRPKESERLPRPGFGAPAQVLLADPDDLFTAGIRMRAFPQNLFPPSVTATDGLDSLVLDRAPRWEPARRQAFLDWLSRGGTVHLLPGEDGRYPQSGDDLAALNAPVDRFRVGAGLVVRHRVGRREISAELLANMGFPAPELKVGRGYIRGLENVFFQQLKELTRPEHNWTIIYTMVAVYIVLIGPVNYLCGRKRREYRLALLLFLALVAGFGFGFNLVGRRGYGERTAVHTLSYARQIGVGIYDVTQWVNTFVTSGAVYSITHPCEFNLYSTCQQDEAVEGIIRNGKEGHFQVDIPLYSSRALLHRGKMKGHDLAVEVLNWKAGATLSALELSYDPGFPQEVIEIRALYQNQVYLMRQRDGHIEMVSGGGTRLENYISSDLIRGEGRRVRGYGWEEEEPPQSPEKVFRRLLHGVIAHGMGLTEDVFDYYVSSRRPRDSVELFIFTRSPEGFGLSEKHFRSETGYVLYHLRLFKPES
jgi:hypothetical protein